MSQLPKDFFDSAADAKKAERDLAKINKKSLKEEDDKEWQEFQKEIQQEIKDSTVLIESDVKIQETEKRADQAYEQLQYEKRVLKLLSRSAEIFPSKEAKKIKSETTRHKSEKHKLFVVEPDVFEESD